jgi:hypothetical protein
MLSNEGTVSVALLHESKEAFEYTLYANWGFTCLSSGAHGCWNEHSVSQDRPSRPPAYISALNAVSPYALKLTSNCDGFTADGDNHLVRTCVTG